MDADYAIELGRDAVLLTLLIGTPVMAMAIVIGLSVSIFQAVTQLQDQTLSFVPKIVGMLVTLLYILPWLLSQMVEYSIDLFHDIPLHL